VSESVVVEHVLVGACDIAACREFALQRAEATARWIDAIVGTVFAAGDNAFPNGSM